MQTIEAIVIGGGLAGSYIAHSLTKSKIPFYLLEASYKLGGRHLSIKDKKDNVIYEAGAWRLHSSHKRMIKLCKNLGLNLNFLEKQPPHLRDPKGTRGLSKLDEGILKNEGDISKALLEELKTGYQGAYDGVSTSNPYSTSTKKGEFYTITEGQEEIINRLIKIISKDNIKLEHRVQDIVREKNYYILRVLYNDKEGEIKEKIIKTRYIFSCVAQFDSWSWTISQEYLYPLLNSVKPIALNHIYVKGEKPSNIKNLRKIPKSVLQQVIPSTHDEDWYQISYSAGRAAMFWYNYKLRYGEKRLKNLLEEYSGIKFIEVKDYFWSHAYHLWLTTPNFNLDKAVKNSIVPNPEKLPNLWWAGECFSSYQGWSEGALETCELVLNSFYGDKKAYLPLYKNVPKNIEEYLIFDSRILDVKSWKNVHPGSKILIQKHLGEDISKRFRYIKHSELSWAALYSLQIGWLKK